MLGSVYVTEMKELAVPKDGHRAEPLTSPCENEPVLGSAGKDPRGHTLDLGPFSLAMGMALPGRCFPRCKSEVKWR